jgi:uncharacterized membrane protein YjdF
MDFRNQNVIAQLIWGLLLVAIVVSLFSARWSLAFVATATLALSRFPSLFIQRFQIKLPQSFIAFIVSFVFAAIFLGEAFDFYERYWWWDIVLHGVSAIGFGLIGFLFAFMLFEGDRYRAPPIALSFIAYCIAVSIGAAWEIFEFAMDQLFGLNMQKSGLLDTMGDLIVDMIGAALGALAGFFYLKRWRFGGLAYMIRDFVRQNRHIYRKDDDYDP